MSDNAASFVGNIRSITTTGWDRCSSPISPKRWRTADRRRRKTLTRLSCAIGQGQSARRPLLFHTVPRG